MRRLFEILIFLSMASAPCYADSSIAVRLQAILSAVDTLHSPFIQTTFDSNNRIIQTSEGELWLGGGARFRIKTTSPFEQTLVSNGLDFWSYDADLAQVIVSPLERDVRKVPILLFGNTDPGMLANYELSFYEDMQEGITVQHFVLDPISPDSLFEILTIGFIDSKPIEISILDNLGQKTSISFADAEVNLPVLDSVFFFEAPENIDVIDDR